MNDSTLALLIPISATLLGSVLAMLVVYFDHLRRHALLKHLHQERMAAIEKGIALPTERQIDPEDWIAMDLPGRHTTGLVLLLLGAAMMEAMWEAGSPYDWRGLLPAALGLAALLSVCWEIHRFRSAARKRAARRPLDKPRG